MLEPIQDNDNYKPHAKKIQIYPCLLKLSRKQESVTDRYRQTDGRYYYIPHRYRGGIKMCYNWQPVFSPTFVKSIIRTKYLSILTLF